MMARSPHSPSAVTYCRHQGIIIHTRTLQDLFAHPFRAGRICRVPSHVLFAEHIMALLVFLSHSHLSGHPLHIHIVPHA